MLSACQRMSSFNRSRYGLGDKFHYLVAELSYLDRMARRVSCSPNWMQLLLSGGRGLWIFVAMTTGVLTGQQYRLHGKHSHPATADRILATWDRVLAGYGCKNKSEAKQVNRYFKNIFCGGILIGTLLAVFKAYQ